MTPAPAPRQRTRPASVDATPYGYPVVGGPRRPDMSPNGVFPPGSFHHLRGRTIKQWPYRTGDALIGLIYHQYATVGKDWKFIATHIYECVNRTWRYAGTAASWDEARDRLDALYEKRNAVQPVATPAPRMRARPAQSGT